MRRSTDELLNELHMMTDSLGGGTVKYNGVGYTVTLYNANYYGSYYSETFTGIKNILKRI